MKECVCIIISATCRCAEGYHALARARAAPSSGGGDMFASDEDEPTEPPAKRQVREALPGGNQAEAREGANGAAAGAANGGEGDRWRVFGSWNQWNLEFCLIHYSQFQMVTESGG